MKTMNKIILSAALVACVGEAHGMLRVKTAVAFAKRNKLKTAGLVIAAPILLDVAQTAMRWGWHNVKDREDIKTAKEEAARFALNANLATEETFRKQSDGQYSALGKAYFLAKHAERSYNAWLFKPRKVSYILRGFDRFFPEDGMGRPFLKGFIAAPPILLGVMLIGSYAMGNR